MNTLTCDDIDAVWQALEKAIEHNPADTMHKPVDAVNKLVEARLALRFTCLCCGQRSK